MRIYDDGWYVIQGIKSRKVCNCHYFFKDKPIHNIRNHSFEIDLSIRHAISENEENRPCKVCLDILRAYSKIGLENRCI